MENAKFRIYALKLNIIFGIANKIPITFEYWGHFIMKQQQNKDTVYV